MARIVQGPQTARILAATLEAPFEFTTSDIASLTLEPTSRVRQALKRHIDFFERLGPAAATGRPGRRSDRWRLKPGVQHQLLAAIRPFDEVFPGRGQETDEDHEASLVLAQSALSRAAHANSWDVASPALESYRVSLRAAGYDDDPEPLTAPHAAMLTAAAKLVEAKFSHAEGSTELEAASLRACVLTRAKLPASYWNPLSNIIIVNSLHGVMVAVVAIDDVDVDNLRSMMPDLNPTKSDSDEGWIHYQDPRFVDSSLGLSIQDFRPVAHVRFPDDDSDIVSSHEHLLNIVVTSKYRTIERALSSGAEVVWGRGSPDDVGCKLAQIVNREAFATLEP